MSDPKNQSERCMHEMDPNPSGEKTVSEEFLQSKLNSINVIMISCSTVLLLFF